MRAAIYLGVTGIVSRIVDCPDPELPFNCNPGEYWIEDDGQDWTSMRVIAGVAVPFAPGVDERRAAVMASLKAERDRRVFGGFAWDGSVFDSDETAQARILGCYVSSQASPESFPIAWRLADNSWRDLTPSDSQALFLALQQHLQSHFAAFAVHEAAIAAASGDELPGYDVTTGWPS